MISQVRTSLSILLRISWMIGELFMAQWDYVRRISLMQPEKRRLARARWIQTTSKRLNRVFRLEIQISGITPETGLLVANHLSYLDVTVLGSLFPSRFTAKSEVKGWPIFGWLATMGGTIFLQRGLRMQASNSVEEISRSLNESVPLVLFPEGTST